MLDLIKDLLSEFFITIFLTMTTTLFSALDVFAKIVRMTLAVAYIGGIVVQPCWFTNLAEGLPQTKHKLEIDKTWNSYFHTSCSHL